MPRPRPLPGGFAPYVFALSSEEVAARHGLRPAEILHFDANVSPLPGVLQMPPEVCLAGLNEYPEGTYRELREAAGVYAGVPLEQVVVGAGADDLIGLVARTFLAPGRRAAVVGPTYPLYAIASAIEGAEVSEAPLEAGSLRAAHVVWVCNPNNPSGELVPPAALARLALELPDSLVAVDEAYYEYAGETVVPLLAEAPNLVAIRTLSKAFGLAALRVGYAVAAPETARELDARRAPGPISAPAARIGAAALRDPRLDVEATIAERERMRAALLACGYDCPPVHANFVLLHLPDAAAAADRLEREGLVVRRLPDALRITVRLPAENDRLLAALGAGPPDR